ncbi:MAG: S1 RNA-binding domain-containing protein, partial [Clostridia bacterium]|nr:S1 RNA-binding domain-containing protein [Clostridia bacterium]
VKFNLNSIEETFANYKKNNIYDGVVVSKTENGVIFNIGGKSDAFIAKHDFENFDDVKIGDRFKALVLGTKTEDGMIEVSREQAEEIITGSLKAEALKVGSTFTFVVNSYNEDGLYSKLGPYTIFVHKDQVDTKVHHLGYYKSKQLEAIVLEIDKDKKSIIASVRMLKEQAKENAEINFWSSAFVGKKVMGKIVKIMPYGAFVDVAGVDAFVHISDLSYRRIKSPSDVVSEGQEYEFRITKLDKEANKVQLGLKQNQEDPKISAIKSLKFSEIYEGVVTKILPFGAIIELENGASGLLHISDATDNNDRRIYEIVKLDEKVKVGVKSISDDNTKVSFVLYANKNN